MAKLPKIDVVNPTSSHTASLFFFHGSGATGSEVKKWVDILNGKEFKFPHIKVIYPTAPCQPYTLNNGMPSHVWFDRKGLSMEVPEDTASIDSICKTVLELIDDETSKGIPDNRIVVAGFSMGGALSMYLSYRFRLTLAGCCAMSSFLNNDTLVYQSLKQNRERKKPPLLQFHGTSDSLVPIQWGEESSSNVKELGVDVEFVRLNNVDHELSRTGIEAFKKWLLNVLPE